MPLISSLGVMNALNFGMTSSQKPKNTYLIISVSSATQVYPFSKTGTIGTLLNSQSSSVFSGTFNSKLSNDGKSIVTTGTDTVSKYLEGYRWTVSGFGTKFANPTQPAVIDSNKGLFINSLVDKVIIGTKNTPFIQVYNYSSSSGFGTIMSNPATLPPGNSKKISLSSDEKILTWVGGTSPYIAAFKWDNSTGIGTKYANPSTLPTAGAGGFSCDVVPLGSDDYNIAILMQTNPNVNIYKLNYTSGFSSGVTLQNATFFDAQYNPSMKFSNSGKNLVYSGGSAITASNTRNMHLNGTFPYSVNLETPLSYPSTAVWDMCFNSSGDKLAMGCYGGAGNSGTVTVYNFTDSASNNSSWGTKISNSLSFSNTSVNSVQLIDI
jgi:hypothetical protein